jgi:hypothetical protein
MNDRPEIMNAEEVACELRVSKAHVHNLLNGKVRGVRPLPSISLGRRRIIRRSMLEEWMRDNEQTAGGILRSSSKVDAVDA